MDEAALPLIDAIERFLRANGGMSPHTFGRLSMKDPHFVRDVRNGRRLFAETEAKVRRFMEEYQADTPPPFPHPLHGTDLPAPGTTTSLKGKISPAASPRRSAPTFGSSTRSKSEASTPTQEMAA